MSWGVARRQTKIPPTLRPHYSLLQAEVNVASIATLLARFQTVVRICTRSLPTQCLEQNLPQFRFTAATAGVYLIINLVLLRSRTKSSASARYQGIIIVGVAQHQLVQCLGRSPLARAVSKRQKSTQDFFLTSPNFNRTRKTLRTCKVPSL